MDDSNFISFCEDNNRDSEIHKHDESNLNSYFFDFFNEEEDSMAIKSRFSESDTIVSIYTERMEIKIIDDDICDSL